MPQIQVCAQGHRWNPSEDQRPSVEERWTRCPHCGAGVEYFSLRDTGADRNGATPANGVAPTATDSGLVPLAVQGYDQLEQIARGGVGVIYKGRHLATGREVALKMLVSGPHASPRELLRFRAEAEAASRLDHPNIVHVYEVGEQGGLPFFALEYMDRGSLADALAGAPLPPRHAAELIELLARTMQYAHDQGIVHRDLKPGNVLLATPSSPQSGTPAVVGLLGTPKITDFGLVKRLDATGAQTATGALLGTPAYMAPEQATGQANQATSAVDVWALGAVLYELLTGKPPFSGASVLDTLDQVRSVEPTRPDQLVPEVPRALAVICLKAMEKDVARRYASAQALADDLRRFLDGQAIQARPVSLLERGVRRLRQHPAVTAVVAGALLIACLGIGAGWWIHANKGNGSGITPPPPAVNETRTQHFASFVRRFGVPEGVHPLDDRQRRRRELSYRFHLRGERVERVEAVDRHGRLTTLHSKVPYLERAHDDDLDTILPRERGRRWQTSFRAIPGLAGSSRSGFQPRECRWDYQRNDKGELVKETALDRSGRVVWTFHYTTPTTGYFTDGRGFPRPRAGSGATYVSFVYTADGLTREMRYLDQSEAPRPDPFGIFGKQIEHDARGLEVRISFLGSRGPVPHPAGYYSEKRTHDEQGNLTEGTYRGTDGQLVAGPGGIARETFVYDADGNLTEYRTYDEDDRPRSPGGVPGDGSVVRMTYDSNGWLTRVGYFDAAGKPARGGLYHALVYRHDARGFPVERIYLDTEGRLDAQAGYHTARLTYDEDGNLTEYRLVGINEKATATRPLVPLLKMRYDPRGNRIEEAAFDASGQPLVRAGVHRVVVAHNDRSQPTRISFFGKSKDPARIQVPERLRPPEAGPPGGEGSPTLVSGPAACTLDYDRHGNLTEVVALGLDGQPIDVPGGGLGAALGAGFSTIRLPFPLQLGGGAARITRRYDERGNLLEHAWFNRSGKPVVAAYGVRLRFEYDQHGNRTEAACYGADGKLFERRQRGGGEVVLPSRIRMTYDDDGRLVTWEAHDARSKLLPLWEGVARFEWAYDPHGQLTGIDFFGANGQPGLSELGYARVRLRRDEQGRLVGTIYLDTQGKPVATQVEVVAKRLPRGEPGGYALPAEIHDGDVLFKLDKEPVSCARLVYERLRHRTGREKVEVELLRKDSLVTARVVLPPLRPRDLIGGSRGFGPLAGPPPWLLPMARPFRTVVAPPE